jgi:hypothetical protein
MTFGSAFKKSNELKMKEFSQEKEQLQELSSLRNLDFS